MQRMPLQKANVSVEASLSQYAMDYNDNNVLSVKLTAKDGEGLETSEIAAITADLSELGLNRNLRLIRHSWKEQFPA